MYNRSESDSPLKQLPLALVYCSHSTYQVLSFFIICHAWKQVLFINWFIYVCYTVQAAKAKNEKQQNLSYGISITFLPYEL